jgi:hypothetical protein
LRSGFDAWVEEFQNKFANPHWRIEARRFLPHPTPRSPLRQGARSREQTTIKQRSNKQIGSAMLI